VKLTEVVRGQAIRFLPVAGQTGGRLYGIDLIRALESRYGFWESPKTVADFDLAKGITFLHGLYQRNFVIDKFQVYPNGILAEAKISTEEIDNFLDDIISWARDEVGFTFDDNRNRRAYISNIEIHTEVEFRPAFGQFLALGEHMTEMIRSYGINTNKFEISGFILDADNDSLPTPKPIAFNFERRAGKPYDSGFYFSTASLKTTDHLTLLNHLEEIVVAMTSAS